jgi:hypothetical protein
MAGERLVDWRYLRRALKMLFLLDDGVTKKLSRVG